MALWKAVRSRVFISAVPLNNNRAASISSMLKSSESCVVCWTNCSLISYSNPSISVFPIQRQHPSIKRVDPAGSLPDLIFVRLASFFGGISSKFFSSSVCTPSSSSSSDRFRPRGSTTASSWSCSRLKSSGEEFGGGAISRRWRVDGGRKR